MLASTYDTAPGLKRLWSVWEKVYTHLPAGLMMLVA
jgi:hypothetical protein